jgi:flagellin
MTQVINTNSLSLLTQNNLNKSQSALNTAIERLSSGMRINSAKDDAAGQAIANRFTANIKGLTQATRNANDGISIAQTTEGALTEVNNNLQRIRELSVQAATGTNSSTDLDSIQSEIGQRLDEINRVSEQTQFNGVKVLSADAGKLTVQVGANDGETIDIDLQEISAKTLGLESFNVNGTGTLNKAATEDALKLASGSSTPTATSAAGVKQYDVVTTNALATKAQLFASAKAGDSVTTAAATYTYDAAKGNFSTAEAARTNAATIASLKPPVGSSSAAKVTIGGNSVDVKIDSAGSLTAADGSALYLDSTGNLTQNGAGTPPAATLTNLAASMAGAGKTGGSITVGAATYTASTAAATFAVAGEAISTAALTDTVGKTGTAVTAATLGGVSGITISAAGVIAGTAAYADSTGAVTAAGSETKSYYVQTNGSVTDGAGSAVFADSAKTGAFTLNARSGTTSTADPLKALDAALSKVDKLRSSLGAVQNRFDSVISNLGTTVTNLSSSRSRIEDADYATEVSNMTRAQILQQAGTSVLSQANQTTQGVLSLLR